ALPNHQIIVVVRSDGSGATAQFKLWMLRQFPSDYANLAQHTGGDASHASSYFPTGDFGTCSSSSQPCFTAQNGSTGVTTFTVNTPYSIDYDEYAYALGAAFPVAQVKNAAGFYTLPTAQGVAVALIKAKINTNQADPNYLSQDLSDVYKYQDPRAYPMSMYSYEIIPKQTNNVTSTARGATLAWLSVNAVCEWQRDMGPLGYSPLPMNLVLASLDQLKQIPGIDSDTSAAISATEQGVLKGGANPCNNPTFQPGDDPSHNVLVDTAPFPSGCDATCQAPWKLAGAGTAASGPKQEQQSSTNPTSGTGTTSQGGSGGGGGSVSPGGAGTGTDTTSGDGTAPVPTAAAACDADTGVCAGGTGDGTTGTNGSVQEASNVQAVPTTIAGDVGWTTTQTLGLLAALLVVLVLLAPPILDRMLSTRRGRSGP
ncbi:MAG TPA: substrate-binding domain-containing protein, partial [Candidatus Limnocylindrales bacterium]